MNPALKPLRLFAEILAIVAVAAAAVEFGLTWVGPAALAESAVPGALLDALLIPLLAGPCIFWRCLVHFKPDLRPRPPARASAGRARRLSQRRTAIALTAAAQLFGLILTVASVAWLKDNLDQRTQTRFDQLVERLESDVKRRLQQPLAGLAGIRGLYAGSQSVQRAEFRAYVESQNIAVEFPGIRGFGFIERVKRTDLEHFVAAERADEGQQFSVRSSGDAADLYVVKYIEPFFPNLAAWGYDVGSEPVRRQAVERAVLSGEPTLTARIALVREGAGFLYLMPVYRRGADPATPAQHAAALVGVAFAPISVAEVLNGSAQAASGLLAFELFDSPTVDGQVPIYASGADAGLSADPLQTTRAIDIGGRRLSLRATATPEFRAGVSRGSLTVLAASGLLLSFLSALAVWLLASGRVRAQTLAERMTADLDRLAKVVRHTSNAVSIIDRDMRINWVNPGFVSMTGYAIDQARGKTPGELLGSGKADPQTLKTLADAVAAGTGCRVEILNRAQGGREYWVDTEIVPMHDTQHRCTGFMEIGTDITASKLARQELHLKNTLLDGILENLPCGLSVVDGQLQLVAHNAQFRSLLELPDELFAGPATSFESIIRYNAERGEYGGVDVDTKVQQIVERARHPQPHQFERERPNGVALEVRGTPMPDGGFVTTYTDVSARRQAEAEVQRSAQLLRGAIEAIDEAFVLFDADDRLVFCNDKYREIYAEVADLIVPGVRFEDLVRPGAERGQYAEAVGRVDEWVAERLAAHRAGNTTLIQRHGNGRTLRIIERRLPDGHIVGFRIDISELVRATEAAQAASQAKSQFLANMSHEIRTPMNAILGMLTLLRNTPLNSRQLDYATKAEGAARSLLGLLNDILDFSKVEAGKMALDLRPFRLDRLLRDLSVILSTNAGNKPVEVLFDVDPALPAALVGDDMRLQQVLINLGGNAVKFTHEGEVVLRVRVIERDATRVVLEFAMSDSGIGIAPEHQARIFSGFTQAEATTTRRFGGTGLGLAISQRLVGLMGGELALASTPGCGSTFSFRLAFALAHAEAFEDEDSGPTRPRPASDLRALRVLIIDDNPIARTVLETMSGSLGWQADVAASGAQALELLQRHQGTPEHYQAVFVDWQMPGLDGWQTSQRIRSLISEGEAPLVLMVTAHGREMLAQRSPEDQALLDGFIVKPVTASMLFDAVVDARATMNGEVTLTTTHGQRRLPGLRVLVVEDNPNNQQVVQELLTEEGALVTLANNGQAGVAAVDAADPPFEVVLMDLQMPVMDGLTATAQIRQNPRWRDLPIIAMTANAMASDREACLAAGMNDHVGKPFELTQLVAALRRHTGRAGTEEPPQGGRAPGLPPLAERDGIDAASAIARLGGHVDAYRRMAQSFADDLAGLPDQLDAHLQRGERDEACRLLHTIKGVAATVGLTRLSAVAAAAERQLGAAAPAAATTATAATARLADKLRRTAAQAQARLTEVIRELAPPSGADATTREAGDPATGAALLAELSRLLADADMAALEVHARLQAHGSGALPDAMQALDAAMAALDFERAQEHCRKLMCLQDMTEPG